MLVRAYVLFLQIRLTALQIPPSPAQQERSKQAVHFLPVEARRPIYQHLAVARVPAHCSTPTAARWYGKLLPLPDIHCFMEANCLGDSDTKEKCHTNILYNDQHKKTVYTEFECLPTATGTAATWVLYRTDPPKISKDGKSSAPGQSAGAGVFVAAVGGAFALGMAIML
jgi:hypothetical protein